MLGDLLLLPALYFDGLVLILCLALNIITQGWQFTRDCHLIFLMVQEFLVQLFLVVVLAFNHGNPYYLPPYAIFGFLWLLNFFLFLTVSVKSLVNFLKLKLNQMQLDQEQPDSNQVVLYSVHPLLLALVLIYLFLNRHFQLCSTFLALLYLSLVFIICQRK